MICIFGIGNRHPARIQCADCLRNLVAMRDCQTLTLNHGHAFAAGDLISIDDDLVVVDSTTTIEVGPGVIDEFGTVSVGGLYDQVEFEDKGQCGEWVERDSLMKRCRRCVYDKAFKEPEVSIGAKGAKK